MPKTRGTPLVVLLLACALSVACAEKPAAPPPASTSETAPASATTSPAAPPSDYRVYDAVLRQDLLTPERGEHELECEGGRLARHLAIVGETRPLYPGGAGRDAERLEYLPDSSRPLLAALRALDARPPRALHADSFAVGVPVRLHPRAEPLGDRSGWREPVLLWLSRVAYSADGEHALVYSVKQCRETTPEGPNDGYGLVTTLERRGDEWIVLPEPLALEVE